jgi:hypothetical protein
VNTKLLFISLVFALPVYGQTNSIVTVGDTIVPHKHIKPSFTIGGSIGCSIPKEGYGLTGYYYTETGYIQPGFADPGLYFDVNLECHLSRYFGLMVEANGNINPLDKNYFSSFSATGSGGTFYNWGYLAGPLFNVTFKNGNVIETKVLIGLILLNQATYTQTTTDERGNVQTDTENGSVYSFTDEATMIEFGAKFKFHIKKATYITLGADYSMAYATYLYYEPIRFGIEPGETFGILNTSVGIEFKL